MILAFWTQKGKISGDYDNKGLAFSAEYGRKNALQRGWYIEPQAQLTLGYLDGGIILPVTGSSKAISKACWGG
ncbi:MAG: autotransporter domain-containing protein [Phascolarctobacterium faecium]